MEGVREDRSFDSLEDALELIMATLDELAADVNALIQAFQANQPGTLTPAQQATIDSTDAAVKAVLPVPPPAV